MAAWLLLTLTSTAVPAEINARLSRTQIGAQESFRLIFDLSGDPDGPPDLTVLERDFQILGRSESRSVRSTGGLVSREVRLILTLVPRTTGSLTIPAVSFGRDRSNPLSLEVGPQAANPMVEPDDEVFFEVEADPGVVLEQQQILFTVKLFLGSAFARVRLGEPDIGDPDAIVRRLGETRYERRRNGRSYRVLERLYAVFPVRSGVLTLGPVQFQGLATGPDPRVGQEAGAPAQDPNLNLDRQVGRLASEAVQVRVEPAPFAPQSTPWLPAENVRLEEDWPAEAVELTLGEPLVRRITLIAEGLTAAQLPPLAMQDSPEFDGYPQPPFLAERPTSRGVTARRREIITLVPRRPGVHRMPGVEIQWWDTAAGQRRTAKLPPRVVKVVSAAGREASDPSAGFAPESAVETPPTFPARDKRVPPATPPGRDWAELPPLSHRQAGDGDPRSEHYRGYWPWIALLLAFGGFFALTAWWVGRTRSPSPAADAAAPAPIKAQAARPRPKSVLETAVEAVQTAYEERDAEAARSALLRWAGIVWRDRPPANLGALAQRCPDALAKAILDLDRALYSPQPEPWYERPVWTLLAQVSERRPFIS